MSVEYVTLDTFQNSHEAYIFKAKLESEGIEVSVVNDLINDMDSGQYSEGVKLNVLKNDVAKGMEIYNEIRRYEENEYGSLMKCPSCNIEKVLRAPVGERNIFFRFFPFFEGKRYICNHCQTNF